LRNAFDRGAGGVIGMRFFYLEGYNGPAKPTDAELEAYALLNMQTALDYSYEITRDVPEDLPIKPFYP
jgi:hypothetical protein